MSRNQREGRYMGHYIGHMRVHGYAGRPSAFAVFDEYCERHADWPRPKRRAWTSKCYVSKAQVAKMKANMLATLDRRG